MFVKLIKEIVLHSHTLLLWTLLRRVIESIQLLTILITTQFEWPTSILKIIDNLSWITIDVTDTTYNTLFILICFIITIYASITIIILLFQYSGCDYDCDCDCEGSEISEYFYWFIGDAVLFGILFIPITQLLLEIFHCKDGRVFKNEDIICGETNHILLCIWSSITLFILIIFVFLRANAHDIYQHIPTLSSKVRHDVHNLDAYYSFFRFLAMIMVIIVAEKSPILSSVFLCLVFMIPIVWTIKTLPYVNMIYNYIMCCMLGFNVWSSFALFIVAVIDNEDSWAGFITWCQFIWFVIICCVLCKMRQKYRPLTTHDLRKADDDIDRAQAIHINFDDYLKGSEELKLLLEGNEEKCVMIRPEDTEHFMEFMWKKKQYDLYCIVGCNQAKKDDDKKKWTKEQIKEFCGFLRKSDNLVLFRLNGWMFEYEQIGMIINSLCEGNKNNCNVIDLGNNQLGFDEVKMILDIVKDYKQKTEGMMNLKEINFVGNYVNYSTWNTDLIDIHSLGSLVVI